MKKVLLIEDDGDIAELERDYLEADGFAVDVSSDGDEGMRLARTGDYCLILLDVMLPGADGFAICCAVRKERDVPILMVSARLEDVDKIRDARGVSSIITLLPLDDQIELSGGRDTFERVEKEDLIEKIERILQKFNEREQLIIQLYYYEELSSKEISEILQVSESRISQIHKRLLEKIRENLGA